MSTTGWDPPQAGDACGVADAAGSAALPVDPFSSLAVHYGMLLGVDDFRVLAANPRGKLQLHQAWQHGAGVVWGFPVSRAADDDPRLAVGPGLAVDAWGRELSSPARMCLDVVQWLGGHPECGFETRTTPDAFTFSARLLLRRTACLSRPVPSVSSSCSSGDDVQYTRVHDSGRLELECYPTTARSCVAERAVRQPADERDQQLPAVRSLVRDGVLPAGLPHEPTGWVDAFRMVAAQEVAALSPGAHDQPSAPRLFPSATPPTVLLADLPGITLTRTASDAPWQVDLGLVDLSVRRTHLPTWVIEELLAEALERRAGPVPVADAGGPRVRDVALKPGRVVVDLTADVMAGTVDEAVEIRWLDRGDPRSGWSDPLELSVTVSPASDGEGTRLALGFTAPPASDAQYRLVLRGTGPTPLMGRRPLVPLAGRVGGPPGGAAEGRDVVHVLSGGAA